MKVLGVLVVVQIVIVFVVVLVFVVVAGFLYVGLTSRKQQDEEREWSSRYSAWLMLTAFGWLALSGIQISAMMRPLSSSGTKPVGTRRTTNRS